MTRKNASTLLDRDCIVGRIDLRALLHHDDTRAVNTEGNPMNAAFAGDMEEPFEWVPECRYVGQSPDSPPLRWRIPKEKRPRPCRRHWASRR